MARARHAASAAFDAITIEGSLIAPAMLAQIAAVEAGQQAEADYAIPAGLALRDEIARYFRIGQALYREAFAQGVPTAARTSTFVKALLKEVLGFADIAPAGIRTHEGRNFPVTLEASGGRVPVIVVPPGDELDRASAALSPDGRRRSAASALQDWLNVNDAALWGLACNGQTLRLMRDNASLTRPAYLEADLKHIFDSEDFASFAALWLTIHATRFGTAGAASDCILERWRDAGAKEGVAARERLREGVEAALLLLGNGLVSHPANGQLRQRLADGALPLPDFFVQLLRLIYRLIFLMVVEDRALLHAPAAPAAARKLYADGYSLAALRARSLRRSAWDRYGDKWHGLKIVMGGLAVGEPKLGLPGLAGLFARDATPDLDSAELSNRALLEAIFRLAWLRDDAVLSPVNWRAMETEELGSVYESLLELIPQLTEGGRSFAFANGPELRGNERRRTSSYYTPDSLVQLLLNSGLDPVLNRVESESDDPAAALLSVTVVDPACGSGHFLLAAARRIADRVARVRSGGLATNEDTRHALRDVVRHCIHGVDRNPMAVELAKVALWIETVDPGKPLGFLDANIRCGDALLGVCDLQMLRDGVPDEAYKPLAGDAKDVAKYYLKRNRDERSGQGALDFSRGGGALPSPPPMAGKATAFRALPEDSAADIAEKKRRFVASRNDPQLVPWRTAADFYVAAFITPKTGDVPESDGKPMVPTTATVWNAISKARNYGPLEGQSVDLAAAARAFHWPLEFPHVFSNGGFDVILGNPPWDTMSPDAKEFFSAYDPTVRFLAPADQRQLIAELKQTPGLQREWDDYCYQLYASANFFKESGRYVLFAEGNLGKGDFNVYRMFVELALKLTKQDGCAAQFVPENLYNGANAAAIRKFLFEQCELRALVGFENTKKIWFDIDTRAKFCLYVASRGGSTEAFPAGFGINSAEKLAAIRAGFPLRIPVSMVHEFSPEALAVTEIAHEADIAIVRRLYDRFPKFGASNPRLASRTYSRELDMGNDRDDFSTVVGGIPVYEGRMVEAFDHRAKAYISGRGRAAVWQELPFGSRGKDIRPQWRLAESDVPDKIGDRWLRYRIGFCDVASPTNQRALVAAIIPPQTVCGDKVPTVELSDKSPELSLLLLAVMNALCMDFVARKKVALKMAFNVVDSLPLPRSYSGSPLERDIVRRALLLAATGPEMLPYWQSTAPRVDLDLSIARPVEDPARRRQLRAELDVLIARDLYGLTIDEMSYLLDPVAVLGPDCGFETFGALKRSDEREFGGRFFTRDLILETWTRLPSPSSNQLGTRKKPVSNA